MAEAKGVFALRAQTYNSAYEWQDLNLNLNSPQKCSCIKKRPENYTEALEILEFAIHDVDLAKQENIRIQESFTSRILDLSTVRAQDNFKKLRKKDKKARIDFLWEKVRIFVRNKPLWREIDQYLLHKALEQRDPLNMSHVSVTSLVVGTDN